MQIALGAVFLAQIGRDTGTRHCAIFLAAFLLFRVSLLLLFLGKSSKGAKPDKAPADKGAAGPKRAHECFAFFEASAFTW